jgi:arylsulfatase A-like enzyme
VRSLLIATALLLKVTTIAPGAERPNIVLIVADDLGWADLGCYGSKYHKTPHIDRLAADGMRFTQAFAAAPVCSPTRASIMTGRHPARLGITDWLPGRPDRPDQKLLRPPLAIELPADVPTLPQILKKAGYATGLIGKWHLGGKGSSPTDRGFDVNVGGSEAGSPLGYFAPFKAKDGRVMPGLEVAPEGEYLTDRLAAEAEKFLDAHKDKPFFLYLAHYAPHIPMKAKADLIAKYKPGQPGQQGNPVYAAMLESLDDAVGRVLTKLDDLKLSERTIVVFTSDNGGLCTALGSVDQPQRRRARKMWYSGSLYSQTFFPFASSSTTPRSPWLAARILPFAIRVAVVTFGVLHSLTTFPSGVYSVTFCPGLGCVTRMFPLRTRSIPLVHDVSRFDANTFSSLPVTS